MIRKHILFWGAAAGMALAGTLIVLLARRPGLNVVRNGGFDEGLRSWGWYAHRSHGARAEFAAENVRGANGRAAKIIEFSDSGT